MFKDVLNHSDLSLWAQAGLVIFFVCFVAVTIWVIARPRGEMDRCASLPLGEEGNTSVAPTGGEEGNTSVAPTGGES